MAEADADADADATATLDDESDGLTHGEEADLGTDPTRANTDGDGWSDGDEVHGNTDPNLDSNHPNTGGWPIGACRDSVVSTSTSVGAISDDFVLVDPHGENLHLHDVCDKTVLLVSAAFWRASCQAEADDLEGEYQDDKDDGFIAFTRIAENASSQPPPEADLQDWANTSDLNHPVVADRGWIVTLDYVVGYSVALPPMHVLAPGMEVLEVDSWVTEQDVIDALP